MFKFADKRQVLWPVEIRLPIADGSGGVEKCQVKVLYELLDRDEYERHKSKSADDLLTMKIKGWEDIGDADGVPMPFSKKTLRALLKKTYIFEPFFEGLFEVSSGAPSKNLKAGSVG